MIHTVDHLTQPNRQEPPLPLVRRGRGWGADPEITP